MRYCGQYGGRSGVWAVAGIGISCRWEVLRGAYGAQAATDGKHQCCAVLLAPILALSESVIVSRGERSKSRRGSMPESMAEEA